MYIGLTVNKMYIACVVPSVQVNTVYFVHIVNRVNIVNVVYSV